MKSTTIALGLWFFAGACAHTAYAGEIHGIVQVAEGLTKKRVTLPAYQSRGMTAPRPGGGPIDEMSRVIVYLEGSIGAVKPITAEITQRNRRFEPEILAVPQGSTVSFPNADPIFHNVFSLSKLKSFDLGYYPAGSTRTVRFDRPGAVQVYCHLHSDMSALILVTPNGHYTQPASSGTFEMTGLAAGTYHIVAWHKAAGLIRKTIEVPENGAVEIVFSIPMVDPVESK